MKALIKGQAIKKIIIMAITIITLFNFTTPNYVQAATDPGVKLVSGFFYLLNFLGDVGIKAMQYMMVGTDEIKDSDNNYVIKYSPGVIFSNTVPGLDINFINPNQSTIKQVSEFSNISMFPYKSGLTNETTTLYTESFDLTNQSDRSKYGDAYNDLVKKRKNPSTGEEYISNTEYVANNYGDLEQNMTERKLDSER